jgi:hypothetical protein
MGKKNRKRGQNDLPNPVPDAAAQVRPDIVLTEQNVPDQPVRPEIPPQEAGRPDYSRRYFLIFWIVIVIAAAAAWILAILLPNVRESIIERWMMAALAFSLAVFLFFYK